MIANAAVDGEAPDVAVQVLGAHVVEDDVGTRTVGGLLDLGDEVLLAVVDQDVRAQLGAALQLLLAARGDGDGGADGLGQLDRHGADAAGAAVHEQRLAGTEVGDHEDVRPHRAGHLWQRRGPYEIDPLGHGQQLSGRYGDLLGVSAAREQGTHLVADGPAGDTGAERGDPAGALQAGVGRGARRRVVEALPLEDVRTVDGTGHHLDQYLALAGYGIGDLVPDQRLGTTRFGNRDRMHKRDATPRSLVAASSVVGPIRGKNPVRDR